MRKVRTRIDTHLFINIPDTPTEAIAELQEAFTRGNPKFYKTQRMGFPVWNIPRKIESWARIGNYMQLPRGAFNQVKEILEKNDATFGEILDKTLSFPPVGFEMTDRLELRPYQANAARALFEAVSGTMRGPCGCGKTVALIAAIALIDQPTLVVVHSKALAQQWRGTIHALLGVVPGIIESGKKTIKPITIALQQSLWRGVSSGNADWLNLFGCIVGDEIHHWAAATFNAVAGAFPAKWRIGASADERRKDGLEFLIYETFGEPVAKIKKEMLVSTGKLLPSRMTVVETSYLDTVYTDSLESRESPDWVGMINRMVEDEERNQLIEDTIKNLFDAGRGNFAHPDVLDSLGVRSSAMRGAEHPALETILNERSELRIVSSSLVKGAIKDNGPKHIKALNAPRARARGY